MNPRFVLSSFISICLLCVYIFSLYLSLSLAIFSRYLSLSIYNFSLSLSVFSFFLYSLFLFYLLLFVSLISLRSLYIHTFTCVSLPSYSRCKKKSRIRRIKLIIENQIATSHVYKEKYLRVRQSFGPLTVSPGNVLLFIFLTGKC